MIHHLDTKWQQISQISNIILFSQFFSLNCLVHCHRFLILVGLFHCGKNRASRISSISMMNMPYILISIAVGPGNPTALVGAIHLASVWVAQVQFQNHSHHCLIHPHCHILLDLPSYSMCSHPLLILFVQFQR